MVYQEFFSLAEDSLRIIADQKKGAFKQPLVIVIGDQTCDSAALQNALRKGAIEYEKFLETGDPEFAWKPPQDEWKSIALGYTSGTTSNPKGVVLHHRGAYLMSLSGALVWGMKEGPVYLWTFRMFHCNGWCYNGRLLLSAEQAYVFLRYALFFSRDLLTAKCLWNINHVQNLSGKAYFKMYT